VFGTDAGSPVVGHHVIAPEMEFMVQLGVVPDNYAAIRSATCAAAQLSRLDSELGTLEAGKRADLIVVDGDPRADIQAMARTTPTLNRLEEKTLKRHSGAKKRRKAGIYWRRKTGAWARFLLQSGSKVANGQLAILYLMYLPGSFVVVVV